ncbi:hypothetical protein B484DRAFT_457073 [Ochromonadaceae sp. CCMP2298]|nr:hypothetical protein B484DRAFT_457073 [Ochromonadaceae sp. CCMP2298]
MALSAGSSHLGLLFIIASAIFFQSPGCLDIAYFLPVSTHTSGEYTLDSVECGVYSRAVKDLGAVMLGDCQGGIANHVYMDLSECVYGVTRVSRGNIHTVRAEGSFSLRGGYGRSRWGILFHSRVPLSWDYRDGGSGSIAAASLDAVTGASLALLWCTPVPSRYPAHAH